MTAYQDHQIIGKPGVLHSHPRPLASDFLRLLQHLVHLIEVKIAEQGRNDGLNAKDNFQFERTVRYRQEVKGT
jgi:hypothetical protein